MQQQQLIVSYSCKNVSTVTNKLYVKYSFDKTPPKSVSRDINHLSGTKVHTNLNAFNEKREREREREGFNENADTVIFSVFEALYFCRHNLVRLNSK